MNLRVRLIRCLAATGVLAGVSILCAGGVNVPALRVYLVTFGTMDFITAVVIDPALAMERSQPYTAGNDPVVRPLASALFVATVALGALDVGRIHWASPFSKEMQRAAIAVFVAANALQIWAMRINEFFSTALRLQPERGHRLVRNGPYRYVRHPGYLAMLLLVPSTAFALGSRLALLPAALYAALILFRIQKEDRYLLLNLPGYADYIAGAPYRLIPGIW